MHVKRNNFFLIFNFLKIFYVLFFVQLSRSFLFVKINVLSWLYLSMEDVGSSETEIYQNNFTSDTANSDVTESNVRSIFRPTAVMVNPLREWPYRRNIPSSSSKLLLKLMFSLSIIVIWGLYLSVRRDRWMAHLTL